MAQNNIALQFSNRQICALGLLICLSQSLAHAQQPSSRQEQTGAQPQQEMPVPPTAVTDATPAPSATPAESPTEAAAASRITSLTRVVGEAGTWFVTSREVKINAAVEEALQTEATPDAKILTGNEKAFAGEVSRVLDEWVVYLEAKSLSSHLPQKAEVSQLMKKVAERWGEKPAWQALEVSTDELRDLISRKLMARDFERLKSDPQLSPISDEEAQAYFRKNRLRFGSLPFETFKENIKAYLVKSQTERRLAEWHEVLRRKYKVRNFIAG